MSWLERSFRVCCHTLLPSRLPNHLQDRRRRVALQLRVEPSVFATIFETVLEILSVTVIQAAAATFLSPRICHDRISVHLSVDRRPRIRKPLGIEMEKNRLRATGSHRMPQEGWNMVSYGRPCELEVSGSTGASFSYSQPRQTCIVNKPAGGSLEILKWTI